MTTLTRALAMLALAALLVGLAGVGVILGSDHASTSRACGRGHVLHRRRLGRHRHLRLVAAPGQPLRRADDLDRLRLAADRVHGGRRARASSRSPSSPSNLYIAAFVHLLLSYPEGRLHGRAERRLTVAGYTLAVLGPLPVLLFGFDRSPVGCDCPDSVIQISERDRAGHGHGRASPRRSRWCWSAGSWSLLWRRWRAASGPQRAHDGAADLVGHGAADPRGGRASRRRASTGATGVSTTLLLLSQLVFGSVPFVVPGRPAAHAGRARRRGRRAAAAPRRGARHRTGCAACSPRRSTIRTLRAPLLDRRPLGEARRHADRAAATDRALDRGRARGPPRRRDRPRPQPARRARAAALGRRRGRPGARERAPARPRWARRLEELRRSRARIVEAGLAERRRLERNLHDGAQQRLVALSLTLRHRPEQDRQAARAAPRDGRRGAGGARPARSRSCASWPAASTRRCCPTAACRPPSRRSPTRSPLPVTRRRGPAASGCPSRSRPPPTS